MIPWEKIYTEPNTGCWLWAGSLTSGYGSISVGGKSQRAHRYVYELVKGPIPTEFTHLDHLCRVRCCVNPDHLEPVTPRENIIRGFISRAKEGRSETGIYREMVETCKYGHPWAKDRDKFGRRKCDECRTISKRKVEAKVRATGGKFTKRKIAYLLAIDVWKTPFEVRDQLGTYSQGYLKKLVNKNLAEYDERRDMYRAMPEAFARAANHLT